MLWVFRILFTGAFAYVMWQGAQEGPHAGAGDTTGAYYLGLSLVLAIPTGLVWAPAVAALIVGPIDATFNTGSFIVEEHRTLRLVYWLQKKKHRRLTVFFCLLEALNHPDWPTAYLIGMKNARPGSWTERLFAREVWRFDNVQNALAAHDILRRHGLEPKPHANSQVMWQLSVREMQATPAREPVPLPAAPPPAPLRRNPNISLFEGADDRAPATAGPPAPAPVLKPPTLPLPPNTAVLATLAKISVTLPAAKKSPAPPPPPPPRTFLGRLFGRN